jgi:hypothetical protein
MTQRELASIAQQVVSLPRSDERIDRLMAVLTRVEQYQVARFINDPQAMKRALPARPRQRVPPGHGSCGGRKLMPGPRERTY